MGEGRALGLGGGVHVAFRHDDEEGERERHQQDPGQHHRQLDIHHAEGDRGEGTDQPTDQPHLGGAEEDRSDRVLSHLIGDPGFGGAAGEGVADTPDHLRANHGPERGNRAFQQETAADQDDANQDRQPTAVHIGKDPRRDLEEEAGCLQHGADDDQLEGGESNHRHLIDHVDGEDQGKTERLTEGQEEIDGDRVGCRSAWLQKRRHRVNSSTDDTQNAPSEGDEELGMSGAGRKRGWCRRTDVRG